MGLQGSLGPVRRHIGIRHRRSDLRDAGLKSLTIGGMLPDRQIRQVYSGDRYIRTGQPYSSGVVLHRLRSSIKAPSCTFLSRKPSPFVITLHSEPSVIMSSLPDNPQRVPNPKVNRAILQEIQKVIDTIPPAYLLPPKKNEIFDSPSQALERLQNYSFAVGFAVVIISGKKERVR